MMNHNNYELYQSLKQRWLSLGITVTNGVSLLHIEGFEKRFGVALPSEFRDYLLVVNGMIDGQCDDALLSFLTIERMSDSKYIKRSNGIVDLFFAEFSVFSHYYAIRFVNGEGQCSVFATDGFYEIPISSSFSNFVGKYLSCPAEIAYCWKM